MVATLSPGGRPGTLVVTWIYVFVGIAVQYCLGLGLALLVTQKLPGRRFFRVVFLLPMMITPVGVAYLFRMLTDTDKGPFQPIWQAMGLGLYSWVNDPWGARVAVMLGDIWQWTPFMFIVLLAALEGQSVEQIEAALVDGANRWQLFWHITFPQILPVTTTLVLIRMIEAFKIVDLPNVLTNGGPGTATESLTLQSFIAWRSLNLGGSAAVAYMLLFVVTFIGHRLRQPILRPSVVEGYEHDEANCFARKSIHEPSPFGMVVSYLLLGLWTLVVLFPLYWLLVTSFKLPIDVNMGPFYIPFVDFQPSLHAWEYILVGDLSRDTIAALPQHRHRGPIQRLAGPDPGDGGRLRPDPLRVPAQAWRRPGLSSAVWPWSSSPSVWGRRGRSPLVAGIALFVILLQHHRQALQAISGQQRHRLLADLPAHAASGGGGYPHLCLFPAA